MTSKDFSLAAVDLGSTFAKGALYSPDGSCRHSTSLPVKATLDGASVEHDPHELLEQSRPSSIASGSRACQRHRRDLPALDLPALGEGRRPRPDPGHLLAGQQCHRYRRRSRPTCLGGWLPHRTPPVSLLRRTQAESAVELAARVSAGALNPARWWREPSTPFSCTILTGEPSTEGGLAGRTLLYNLESDAWDPALCDLFDIPEASLPQIRPSIGHRGEWQGIPSDRLGRRSTGGSAGARWVGGRGHGGPLRNGSLRAHRNRGPTPPPSGVAFSGSRQLLIGTALPTRRGRQQRRLRDGLDLLSHRPRSR